MGSVRRSDFVYNDRAVDDFDYQPVGFDYEPIEFDYKAVEGRKPEGSLPKFRFEHTLAIIRPHAISRAEEIEAELENEGFGVLKKSKLKLSPELASELYKEHYGAIWFPKFILKMSKGPMVVLCLAKDNAIDDLRELLGPSNVAVARRVKPYCLRAKYGMAGGDRAENAIHASENVESAEREIHFFFKQAITEPMREDKIVFIKEKVLPTLLKGLSQVSKERPKDPLLWLADWLLENNPQKPKFPLYLLKDKSESSFELKAS